MASSSSVGRPRSQSLLSQALSDSTLDDPQFTPASTPRASSFFQPSYQPRLPDVQTYSWGTTLQLSIWKACLMNNLTVDAALYPTEEDKVRYMFSHLRDQAQEVAFRILRGASNDIIEGFASRMVDEVFGLLARTQTRRRMAYYNYNYGTDKFTTINGLANEVLKGVLRAKSASASFRDRKEPWDCREHFVFQLRRDRILHETGCEIREQLPESSWEKFIQRFIVIVVDRMKIGTDEECFC